MTPEARRSESHQRPRTAPPELLDLGPLHQALPRAHLFSQQNANQFRSAPHQQANGQNAGRSFQFLQRRNVERPSTGDGSTKARFSSAKGRASAKRPSTAEGSGIGPTPTPRWERPSLAESNKLFSDPRRAGRLGDPQTMAGRKGSRNNANRVTEHDGTPSVFRLPPDLLCQCFLSVESLYYLVGCGSVCKAWREVLGFDRIWKVWYMKWWDATDSIDPQSRRESQVLSHDTRAPPKGFDSWRSAFIAQFQEGKKKLIGQEKEWAMREGFLGVRPVTDTHGKRVLDCVQGDGMRKLSEHLGLTFSICLNRGRHIKVQGKGKVEIFGTSCSIRYPIAHIGNIDLLGLRSVEVTATSDRLLRACPVVDVTQLKSTAWEMVSTTSQSPGPLRLLQSHLAPGVSLIVGTLVEGTTDVDEVNGGEQVLLIVLSVHLNNLLWKLLDLGGGPTSYAARRLVQDQRDLLYGLHNWNVTVQLHTFRRSIWTRNFRQVFWSQRESTPGEKAVFQLVSHHDIFPGVLTLPWKSEAFSGSLKGVYLLDITLWDGGGEIAWQHTCAARICPASLVVVEYGIAFEGERVYTHVSDDNRGVSVAVNMCIPHDFTYQQALDERPLMAITDLRIGLTRKFLEDWCGVANI